MLNNIFDTDNLEKILIANWTHFLNSSKLMAFVLQKAHEHATSLDIINHEKIKNKSVKITLSRFHYCKNGFLIWVEFTAPIANGNCAEGTMELLLDNSGELNYVSINGNLF